MKTPWIWAAATAAMLLTNGCASNDEYVEKLREAVAQAEVTLADTVVVAEAENSGAAIQAALLVEADPLFSVQAFEPADARQRYRIDLTGGIVAVEPLSAGAGPCSGTISLLDAIDVAEGEANGVAVAIVPDDDVSCAFEVQVLTAETLWEVKVGPGGDVLESEESDEDGSPDDD